MADEAKRPRKTPIRTRNADLAEIKGLSFVALKQDLETLVRKSKEGKLTVSESDSLVKYLKLIRDLEKKVPDKPGDENPGDSGEADLSQLSDEELKKAAQNKTEGDPNV